MPDPTPDFSPEAIAEGGGEARCGALFWVDGLAYICSRTPHDETVVHGSSERGVKGCTPRYDR